MKLYGRNSVFERLKLNSQSIKSISIDKGANFKEFERRIRSKNIPIRYLSEHQFHNISRNIRAQGIIAEVEDFRYVSFEDTFKVQTGNPPVILFLDNLNDPQNLGSILRSAACLGGFAVVLPKHDSVEITEAVLRVASGAENYIPVAQVTNLSLAVQEAKKNGYWIAGALTENADDITKSSLSFPLGIIIGSEAKGIRQGLLKYIDFRFTIPTQKKGLSLNVATATALFCYEVIRQSSKQA